MDFAADAGIYECDKRGTGIKKSISQNPLKKQKICGKKITAVDFFFFLHESGLKNSRFYDRIECII